MHFWKMPFTDITDTLAIIGYTSTDPIEDEQWQNITDGH